MSSNTQNATTGQTVASVKAARLLEAHDHMVRSLKDAEAHFRMR